MDGRLKKSLFVSLKLSIINICRRDIYIIPDKLVSVVCPFYPFGRNRFHKTETFAEKGNISNFLMDFNYQSVVLN